MNYHLATRVLVAIVILWSCLPSAFAQGQIRTTRTLEEDLAKATTHSCSWRLVREGMWETPYSQACQDEIIAYYDKKKLGTNKPPWTKEQTPHCNWHLENGGWNAQSLPGGDCGAEVRGQIAARSGDPVGCRKILDDAHNQLPYDAAKLNWCITGKIGTAGSCDRNWSSQWDRLRPEYQQTLRQPGVVDQGLQNGGGAEAVVAAAADWESDSMDLQQLRQVQAQGQLQDWTPEQYGLFRRGLLEVARCRTGAGVAQRVPSPTATDPVSRERQDIVQHAPTITDCKEASDYRDNQLVKDFDVAMARYNIFKEGKLNQERIKLETLKLMDHEWWFGKTGAQIATEVKFYTSLFNDTIGWLLPEEYFEQMYGKTVVADLKLVQHDAIVLDTVRKEEEEGAKRAALSVWREYAKEVIGQVGSFIGIYDDLIEHGEDRQQIAKAEAGLQAEARKINHTINQFEGRMQQSRARTQAISEIVAAIDQACAPGAVPITKP